MRHARLVLLAVMAAALAATVAAQAPALPAPGGNCDDGVYNNNETDIDCGGPNCNGCKESQKCFVNSDCDVDAGGCLNNNLCYDSTDAKIVTGFMFVFIWVVLGILLLHSSKEIKNRLFNCKSGRARAEKKRKEAEEERRRALERAEKLTEKEAKDRDAAIGLSVWKSRSGSLDDYGGDDVELHQVEMGENDDSGDEWDLDGAVDGGNVDYARQVLRQRTLEGGEGRAALHADDRKQAEDDEPPALIPQRLGGKGGGGDPQPNKVRPPGRDELIEIGAKMREEALKHREQHLPELLELNVVAKSHAGLVRQSIAIINATTSILAPLRLKAVTQLRILSVAMLMKYGLLNMSESDVDEAIVSVQRAARRIGWALNNTKDIDNSRKTLHDAMKIVRRVAKVVRSPRKNDVMEPVETVIDTWKLTDPEFLVAQLDAEADLASHKDRVQQMYEKVMLARTPFVTSKDVSDKANKRSMCSMIGASLFPPALRAYPQFYSLFFAGMAIIFTRFAAKIGSDSNQEVQDVGTFLPVPPYYQLDKFENQRTLVPLIYAFMHSALWCFCFLPLAFARGVLRDLSNALPRLRRFAPLDDMVFFHKLLGVITLLFLFIGGCLFYISLADECREGDVQSCIAFDPLNPDNGLREASFTHNPFQNVVALRKTVWFTWFPIFPLLHWAHIDPPRILPNVLRLYWFEFVFYSHHFVAHVSFITAQICRFDVFYPALITWGIYYLDTLREMIFNTHATHVAIHPALQSGDDGENADSSVIHTDDTGRPTLVNLRIDKPLGFSSGAGQIVYLKVPEISKVEWHPFSIASASQDQHIELQIGVIGGKPNQWVEDQNKLVPDQGRQLARVGSAERILAPRVPDANWRMKERPTWTYKLQELLRQRITQLNFLDDPEGQADHVDPIKVLVRGPYGSPFTRCFSPSYTGCVIIGAGTGLTAAISVLREIIDRRKRGVQTPPFVWFVWSCRRADDLLWCWDALQELVLEALNDGVLRPGPNWTPQSNMLDWLSITVYVTRANQKILDKFLADQTQREQPKLDESNARALRDIVDEDAKLGLDKDESIDDGLDQAGGAAGGGPAVARFLSLRNSRSRDASAALQLSKWLSSDKHTLRGSPDEPDIHVGKVLKWARVYVNRKAGRHKKMTACFCGPPALAHILHDAASDIGAGMEFSAEHQ